MSDSHNYSLILNSLGTAGERWSPNTLPSLTVDPQQVDTTKVQSIQGLPFLNIGTAGLVGDVVRYEQMRGVGSFPAPQRVTAAGVTALFTPPSGNAFRLLGFTVSVCAAIASGPNVLEVTILADAREIWMGNAFCDATIVGQTQMGADFGQGEKFAVDEVLNINLSEACTSGSVAVTAWGCVDVS